MSNAIFRYFKIGLYFELILLVITLVLGFLGIAAATALDINLMNNINLTLIIVVLLRFVVKGFIIEYLSDKVN